jgi:hypothetical protein
MPATARASLLLNSHRSRAGEYIPRLARSAAGEGGSQVHSQNRTRPGVPRRPGLGASTDVWINRAAQPERVAHLTAGAKQNPGRWGDPRLSVSNLSCLTPLVEVVDRRLCQPEKEPAVFFRNYEWTFFVHGLLG